MSSTFADRDLSTESIVEALTGPPRGEPGSYELREQVQVIAMEIDGRTAQAFGKELVESLCENSSDPRRLEALVLLGLAHPKVLSSHRVDLVQEGKRLALLFERQGEVDRAQALLELLSERHDDRSIDRELAAILRRSGSIDELVERHMARANEAIRKGRHAEAIPALQEVLLLDRSRRDVARQIRDLRYSMNEHRETKKRRNRIVLGFLVVVTIVGSIFMRERQIGTEIASVPEAGSELESMRGRLIGLDTVLAQHRFWFGMFGVMTERERLGERIATVEERTARERQEEQALDTQRTALAEAARERGLQLARRGEFEAAIEDLHHSLELSRPDWPQRKKVLDDLAAIEEYQRDLRTGDVK